MPYDDRQTRRSRPASRNGRTEGDRPLPAANRSRRNERALRATQDQLEAQLIAAPATTWEEVADKVRYLLSVLGATPSGQDPRRQTLIKAVLDDFSRRSRDAGR